MANSSKNIRGHFDRMAVRPLVMVLAILLSTSLVMAQNGKKKRGKISQKTEFTKKPVSSHRNLVKGKQKEHSKYQGNEPTNN